MISVIVPVYNQQEYLNDCIDSILDNNLGERVQIIIVNDGSTDNSLEIAKRYRVWSNVKVIDQVNKGLASARNTGIMNAKFDWIFPLDADDMIKENCLEKILVAIKENPEADIIAPSFKEFGVRNQEVILMDNPTIEDFNTGNRIPYFSAIRRSKLWEVGGYSPRMIFGYEDYHLWFNLLTRNAKIKTLKDVLVLYRTKEKSMIHDALDHHEELMVQINKDFNLW
ncbi:glycosyltransferase family A protein [Pedobacter sp.]|jgi:glycosyltransferase involved in cell wall biosynthesis|uniref:glycosyltransferase family 2 protein n=1 Tax=Pedobacter sp. TaxID=1411316 RepID=UPI002BCEB767|nr:glycosyltransferase family A protein [Pedobacter sp.]HWW42104.1 glycosyltransferase family A protein [Pedobacter sp.]